MSRGGIFFISEARLISHEEMKHLIYKMIHRAAKNCSAPSKLGFYPHCITDLPCFQKPLDQLEFVTS